MGIKTGLFLTVEKSIGSWVLSSMCRYKTFSCANRHTTKRQIMTIFILIISDEIWEIIISYKPSSSLLTLFLFSNPSFLLLFLIDLAYFLDFRNSSSCYCKMYKSQLLAILAKAHLLPYCISTRVHQIISDMSEGQLISSYPHLQGQ